MVGAKRFSIGRSLKTCFNPSQNKGEYKNLLVNENERVLESPTYSDILPGGRGNGIGSELLSPENGMMTSLSPHLRPRGQR